MALLTKTAFAQNSFFFLNSYRDSPSSFTEDLHHHLSGHYESEHPTDMANIMRRLEESNLGKSLNRPSSFIGGFNVSVDLFVFDVWAGVGRFQIESSDKMGRSLLMSGNAPFVGGQIIFPYALDANVILEGKYWYFPSLAAAGTSAVNDLRESSLAEGIMVYQKRIPFTSFSYRLGALGMKVPLAKDHNASTLLGQSDVEFRSLLLGGLFAGLKFAPNRWQGIEHLIYSDLVALPYSDSRFLHKTNTSYVLRIGYKWFLSRRWALTVDGEAQRFYSKYEDEVRTQLWGLGLQLFLF